MGPRNLCCKKPSSGLRRTWSLRSTSRANRSLILSRFCTTRTFAFLSASYSFKGRCGTQFWSMRQRRFRKDPSPSPPLKTGKSSEEKACPVLSLLDGHGQRLCTEGLNVRALQSRCWGARPRVEGKGKNWSKTATVTLLTFIEGFPSARCEVLRLALFHPHCSSRRWVLLCPFCRWGS